jgi:hypothetical protein
VTTGEDAPLHLSAIFFYFFSMPGPGEHIVDKVEEFFFFCLISGEFN